MMDRYALLINNVALDIIESATNPGGNWINVTGLRVGPGYIWNGSVWEPPAPPTPQVVTMRQARLALLHAGLLNQVQGAIDSLPEPARSVAQISWEYGIEVRRDDPLTLQIAAVTGMSNEQIDDLFVNAATL